MFNRMDSNFCFATLAGATNLPTDQLAEISSISLCLLFTWSLLAVGMAILPTPKKEKRTKEEMERDARKTIKRLLHEFGNAIKMDGVKEIAALYIRYSTEYQDSFEAQLRAALNKVLELKLAVSAETIFFDLGLSGAKDDREGLKAVKAAREAKRFQVFISLATSRFARKLTTLIGVLHEEFVGNGIRCILCDQDLDSNDRQKWDLLLPLLGCLDQFQRTSNSGHIVAAHKSIMARGLKYSSVTYGYRGQPVEGSLTKQQRPAELIVIDEATASVVKVIFEKFNHGTPIARIAKQLNEDPTLPRPPKSTKNRFSRDFVINVLKNEQYLGVAVYNNEVDVSNISPDEMRELAQSNGSVFCFPARQIIPDEVFLTARQRLLSNANKPHLRSPRSNRPASDDRPRLLNGLLFCSGCNNQLVATGAHGNNFGCKTCKYHPIEQQHLFSQMPRKLATELVIDAMCTVVFDNEDVLERSVSAFVASVNELQKPDANTLKILKAERKKVKSRLKLIMSSFSGDEEELVKEELATIRSDLARIDRDEKTHQLLTEQAVSIPTKDAAREMLMDFASVLKHFSFKSDGEELDRARELVRIITSGRIEAYQRGEKAAQKGWCQLRFTVCPAALLIDQVLLTSDRDELDKIEIVLDIVERKVVDPRIAQARALYDEGKFETEIAKEFGVSRGTMFKWIKLSFEAEGRKKPNGYERRKQLETARELHHYQIISDEVFELAESGMHLQEIAEHFRTNRDVITKSHNYARKKRGLPPLDGRTRRKSLPRKPR